MNAPSAFAQKGVQYNMNYTPDTEITDANSSLSFAENRLNHKLGNQDAFAHDHPVNFAQQNLGLDEDVNMAQSSVAESEKLYGKFVPVKDYDGLWKVGKEQNIVQLDADIHLDSDPICSSSGCD